MGHHIVTPLTTSDWLSFPHNLGSDASLHQTQVPSPGCGHLPDPRFCEHHHAIHVKSMNKPFAKAKQRDPQEERCEL